MQIKKITANYAVENCSCPHLCKWKTATYMKALKSNQAWLTLPLYIILAERKQ